MHISPGRLATFTVLLLAFAASALAQSNSDTSKRVVYYYQTQFANGDTGSFVSLLPLIAKENLDKHGKPYTTDVLVGAFHLGLETDGTEMHLNDFPPNAPRFDELWQQTPQLQKKGINVNLYLGGYEDQSFINIAENSSYYYPILKQTIQTYNFSGIDLDVEDGTETTAQIKTLIIQLRTDFGERFIITLAPVASDLLGYGGFSYINYTQLYTEIGSKINWFNVQFYSGGSLTSPSDYTQMVNNGFPANVLVAGMVANDQDGNGFVDIQTVIQTVQSLLLTYPNFGGVDAWEYFNALPGGTADPAQWGTVFGEAMGD